MFAGLNSSYCVDTVHVCFTVWTFAFRLKGDGGGRERERVSNDLLINRLNEVCKSC